MKTINRSAVIIRPKKPYILWANSHSGDGREFTPESFKNDSNIILIPDFDTDKEAREHIDGIWELIFKNELKEWNTDESSWPKDMDQKMFSQWFDVEFHSVVYDPYYGPIVKDEK